MLPEELLQNQLWWSGPPWLLMEPPLLPAQPLAPALNSPELASGQIHPRFRHGSQVQLIHQVGECHSTFHSPEGSVSLITLLVLVLLPILQLPKLRKLNYSFSLELREDVSLTSCLGCILTRCSRPPAD